MGWFAKRSIALSGHGAVFGRAIVVGEKLRLGRADLSWVAVLWRRELLRTYWLRKLWRLIMSGSAIQLMLQLADLGKPKLHFKIRFVHNRVFRCSANARAVRE